MKSFKEYVTLNEAKKGSNKKGSDLKVGDVILCGREDTPHEVISKPKQDTLGHWVEVLNLSNKKKDKIWIDTGDTVSMNEKELEDEIELDESDKQIYRKLIELNKGREGKTTIGIDGNEMSSSVYLGGGSAAFLRGTNSIVISQYDFPTNKYHDATLTKTQAKLIAKL